MNSNRKLIWALWIVIALVILAVIFVCSGFIYSAIFAYSQPEYSVDSLSELQKKLERAEENYLLPDEETIREIGYGADYTVYLKDRFHADPAGFYLCIYIAEDYQEWLSVDCRLLETYSEEALPTVKPNEEINGVGIFVPEKSGGSVMFIYNDCYYHIQTESVEHSMLIAKSILDNAE